MIGLFILFVLGAPLLPVSAAVSLDSANDQATAAEAENWHPLSFVYSLLQQVLGNGQDLENGALKSSSGEDTDGGYSADGGEVIPPTCLGPGVEPGESSC